MTSTFYVIIKEPRTDCILGWCHAGDEFSAMRERFPRLHMTPMPARAFGRSHAAFVHCSPETCEQDPNITRMLAEADQREQDRQMQVMLDSYPELVEKVKALLVAPITPNLASR